MFVVDIRFSNAKILFFLENNKKKSRKPFDCSSFYVA